MSKDYCKHENNKVCLSYSGEENSARFYFKLKALRYKGKNRINLFLQCIYASTPVCELRPVYTGDFCRSISMQILSRCNIARVNRLPFYRRDIKGVPNMYKLENRLNYAKLFKLKNLFPLE